MLYKAIVCIGRVKYVVRVECSASKIQLYPIRLLPIVPGTPYLLLGGLTSGLIGIIGHVIG